jgi:hypothetical protein
MGLKRIGYKTYRNYTYLYIKHITVLNILFTKPIGIKPIAVLNISFTKPIGIKPIAILNISLY